MSEQPVPAQHGMDLESGPILTGAVLFGVGLAVAFVGVVLGGTSVIAQALRWLRSMEHRPSDAATERWNRVKAAGSAGASAWRSTAGQSAASSDASRVAAAS